MKRILILAFTALSSLCGCYTTEDAADVNQDRIKANYCTTFNGTRATTKSVINFRFGQTPLRVSHSPLFRDKKLYEKEDIIFGLHYAKTLDGIKSGNYEWTDENGTVYTNYVRAYSFSLPQPPSELKKFTYYKLNWQGEEIPYEEGNFTVSIKSLEEHVTTSFSSGPLIEIHSDDLIDLPTGRARMTISRQHQEPVDEGTQAGGQSRVIFEQEYEILIID